LIGLRRRRPIRFATAAPVNKQNHNNGGDNMSKTGIRLIRWAAILGAVFVAGFMADTTPATWQSKGSVVSQAEAVYGRPATPRSAAGHRRRVVRRGY
jgi:hypothetical protein